MRWAKRMDETPSFVFLAYMLAHFVKAHSNFRTRGERNTATTRSKSDNSDAELQKQLQQERQQNKQLQQELEKTSFANKLLLEKDRRKTSSSGHVKNHEDLRFEDIEPLH